MAGEVTPSAAPDPRAIGAHDCPRCGEPNSLDGCGCPEASAAPEPLRMSAYYYAFDPTGVVEIDRILSAVAVAGKEYHHTEFWTDDEYGPSNIDRIQKAANEAAAAWREATDAN